jgi:hypothetical protein
VELEGAIGPAPEAARAPGKVISSAKKNLGSAINHAEYGVQKSKDALFRQIYLPFCGAGTKNVPTLLHNSSFGVHFTKPESLNSQGEEWYRDVPFTDLRME